jgi:arginase
MIALLAAPTNLGLRPPQPGSVPGCAKAPEALREAGLHACLQDAGAIDAGVVLAGRYVDDMNPIPGRVRNQDALIDHSRRLAARVEDLLEAGHTPLVLGGDCSLLIGTGLALRRRGQHGLVHIDGHTDFRHPGNSGACLNLAGEDLAAVVGRHWPAVSDLDGLGPYFGATYAVHIGCRDDDEDLAEARQVLGAVITARQLRSAGAEATALTARAIAGTAHLTGYWLHLDVDVLDPEHMPAVDSPDSGGLSPDELTALLIALAPAAVGAQVTIFDPDLDPDGRCAYLLTDILTTGLAHLGAAIAPA